jgi:hypothetical protein
VGRRGVPTSIVCIKEFIAVLGLVENDDDDEVCFGRLYLCIVHVNASILIWLEEGCSIFPPFLAVQLPPKILAASPSVLIFFIAAINRSNVR